MSSISKICTVKKCDNLQLAKGYCSNHYVKNRKYGDPNGSDDRWHGMEKTSEYRSWIEMKRRCLDPKRPGYKYYGAKGVTIYPPWIASFKEFFDYMGVKPTTEHSLDRIKSEGNYEPGNVKWSTALEQQNNRRNHTKLTINGITKNISQWRREYAIPDSTFHNRLRRGWTGERLLSKEDHRIKKSGLEGEPKPKVK